MEPIKPNVLIFEDSIRWNHQLEQIINSLPTIKAGYFNDKASFQKALQAGEISLSEVRFVFLDDELLFYTGKEVFDFLQEVIERSDVTYYGISSLPIMQESYIPQKRLLGKNIPRIGLVLTEIEAYLENIIEIQENERIPESNDEVTNY